jgi:hypothetical protein
MSPRQEEMLKELHTAIVGNETLGHIGLVKRMEMAERELEAVQPIVQAFLSKKEDSKKLRNTIIGSCITLVLGMIGHITTILLLNNK